MRGTIFGAIGARLGTAIAAGTVRAEPEARRRARTGTSRWRSSRRSRRRCGSRCSRRSRPRPFGESSISFWDLVTISVVGGVARVGADPAGHARALGGVVPARLRPGLGRDADGHGPRRHGDAAEPAVPRDLPGPQRRPERDRRGVSASSSPCWRSSRWRSAAIAGVRRIVLEMTAVIALTPILDIAGGRAPAGHANRCSRGCRRCCILIPPFVSQAGALGGILVVAPVLEAPARRDHATRAARAARRGRRRRSWCVLGLAVFTLIGVVGLGARRRDGPAPARRRRR